MQGAGRDRHPEVLAHIDADHCAAGIVLDQQPGGERDRLSVQLDRLLAQFETVGEPALFVKFVVVGQIRLDLDADDLMIEDHGRAVVEPSVLPQRDTDDADQVFSDRCAKGLQRLFAGVEQQ